MKDMLIGELEVLNFLMIIMFPATLILRFPWAAEQLVMKLTICGINII